MHKAPNQKTDMSQKRDPLAEAMGGSFGHKVPNQKKDMTQMRSRLVALGVDSMVKYNCDDTC